MVVRTTTSRTDGTLQELRKDPRDTACWYPVQYDVFWRQPRRWTGDDPAYGPSQWSLDLSELPGGVIIGSGSGPIVFEESSNSTHFAHSDIKPLHVLWADDVTIKVLDWNTPESLTPLAQAPIELWRQYLRLEGIAIRIQEPQNPLTLWAGHNTPQLQLVEVQGVQGTVSSEAQPQLTLADQIYRKEMLPPEPEPSTHPLIVYPRIAIGRILSESRFFANTLKEAFLHPLTASTIDKRTGKVVKQQARTDRLDVLEQPR